MLSALSFFNLFHKFSHVIELLNIGGSLLCSGFVCQLVVYKTLRIQSKDILNLKKLGLFVCFSFSSTLYPQDGKCNIAVSCSISPSSISTAPSIDESGTQLLQEVFFL
jgi:hypothetical protein